MDSKSIVEYIKKNYPKIIFEPIQFEKSLSRALGFIITDDKLVVGFINKNGIMCKLIKPIDLNNLSNTTFIKVIESLPFLKGFTEKDKERIMRIFSNKNDEIETEKTVEGAKIEGDKVEMNKELEEERELLVKELNKKIKQLETNLKTKQEEYDVYYDSQTNKVLLIEKEYQKKLDEIKAQYDEQLLNVQQCKMQLVDQNESIISGINKYKEEMKSYIKGKEMEVEDLKKLYDKNVEETGILQNKLNVLLENEKKRIEELEKNKDLISESDVKINESEVEINKLKETIRVINDELEDLKKSLSKSEMKAVLLSGYKQRCRDKILKQKEEIINAIKDYNEKWLRWSENVKSDVNEYKIKILSELKTVKKNLEESFIKGDLDDKEVKRLKQNMFDIENQLKTTISNQLSELSAKEENIKRLEQERIQIELERERELSDAKSRFESEIKSQKEIISKNEEIINSNEETINENKKTIAELRDELEKLRVLLQENSNVKIEKIVDYDNCYLIVKNFIALNNVFYRKLEIIERLKDIINNNIGVFTHLNESIKQRIKTNFEKVRDEIMVHINFLNLSEYMSSPNIQYLKNKTTREYVPENFCKELTNLLDYWNLNQKKYKEQDTLLTNIYEDLSGAVRVYVRIRPLIGDEQKINTILIEQVDNKKQKLLTIGCVDSVKKTFGEFYGIYEDTFTNLDVYTGQLDSTKYNTSKTKVDLESIIDSSETISPGLYSSFKQVENGYSIVLFGYGISGSGKTRTLLGNKGIPGVLHYGLDNLQNVSNIKLKYLFEQYSNIVNINFNKMTGKIYNLINKIPQLKEFSKDETEIFKKEIPSYIDINNLKIEDIYSLTDIIESYRINNRRIKKTPNNPVSSRSHLYLVFEIVFKNGKTGFVTIVDMAGKESPLDLFNTFIDTTKTKLASIMAPAPVGGEDKISITMRQDLIDSYSPKSIFEILKESFYINESINHLIYYFNKKNYRQYQVNLQSQNSEKYDTSKYYIKPQEEEKNINTSNNSLTIPILKFLDNLSNKNKTEDEWLPTKFITICNIRQEESYCEQTFKTLEFAQSIKST